MLKKSVHEHENWLNALTSEGGVGDRIIEKRDKLIAHIERDFANKRMQVFLRTNPPLNHIEVEDVYKHLNEIINIYDAYLDDHSSPQVFEQIVPEVRCEVDRIIRLIEDLNKEL